MTIAAQVEKIVREKCTSGFSLYAGYGLNDDLDNVQFPMGVQLNELRNDVGMVKYATYQYADDSILAYRCTGDQYSLTVI